MLSPIDQVKQLDKLMMLAIMLKKLSKLYPMFAHEVTWEQAHLLLADFCVPKEFRGGLQPEYNDTYYHDLLARHLFIPLKAVTLGFHCASELEELESQ